MVKTLSIADLRKKLAAQEEQLAKLQAQRDKLAKQLAGIDRKIDVLGGAPAKATPADTKKKTVKRKRAKRARGDASLADVLAKALAGKGRIKVAVATKLALGAGYKSTSNQFGNIVSQTLSNDARFKKLARGIYVLKSEDAAPASPTKKKGKKRAKKAAKKTAKKTAKKPAAEK